MASHQTIVELWSTNRPQSHKEKIWHLHFPAITGWIFFKPEHTLTTERVSATLQPLFNTTLTWKTYVGQMRPDFGKDLGETNLEGTKKDTNAIQTKPTSGTL